MSGSNLLRLALLCNALLAPSAMQYDCSRTEYERCVRIADPLVKEVHLIFPDNKDDIDIVCRTWNSFVDCLRKYTDRCFTAQQRLQFNKAVENPIDSVHQMCMQPNYQTEYLRYASCMKNTVVDGAHCGPHYSLLVDQVDQGNVISKATLCCSHNRFKQCVLKETTKMCDGGIPDGPASRFSQQIIDKALSFLQDQCYNYIPNSGDCATITTESLPFSDTLMISTSPSEVYPWSTVHEEAAAKEIVPSRVVPSRATSTSWLPSSSVPDQFDSSSYSHYEPSYSLSTQSLGTRSRPASYGRASTWSDAPVEDSPPPGINTQPAINTVPPFSESTFASTPVRTGGGATISTWTVANPSSPINKLRHSFEPEEPSVDPTYSSSTTWYPAAGSQLSNEVDEPNQLGLTKPENGRSTKAAACVVFVLIMSILISAFC